MKELEGLIRISIHAPRAGRDGPLVIVWYVIGELGSLAEHAVHMGAPVPEWLPKILAAGKSAVDAAGDKIVGEDEPHEEA